MAGFCSTPGFPLCPLVKQVFLSPSPGKAVAHRPWGGLCTSLGAVWVCWLSSLKMLKLSREATVIWLCFQGQVGKQLKANPGECFLFWFTQRTRASAWLRGGEQTLLQTSQGCPRYKPFGKAWKGYIAFYWDYFPGDALFSRNIEASEKDMLCPRSYLK